MMSLRQAVRLAVFVIRHREIPAALRAQVAREEAADNAFVDQLLTDRFSDELLEMYRLGRDGADAYPSTLRLVTGGTR